MKVVILTETFAKNMSYLGSMLPKYLARCGVEVHVLALALPPYYYMKEFKEIYENLNEQSGAGTTSVETFDGYTIHTLPHTTTLGYVRMKGQLRKLRELSPDIVYSLSAIGWLPLMAAIGRPLLGYRLFTGSHTAASTFPLARRAVTGLFDREWLKCFFLRFVPGRLISLATEKCYGPTKDCAEIAWRFFGVQREKVEVMHLGVDTDYFFPIDSDAGADERKKLRHELGFADEDIVCVYSGKMTEVKNALILAQAVERLRAAGHSFRGLFIGEGVQKEAIARHASSVVLDFMPYQQLARYYRAADVGVWPTNESTSMLDAAACGIPLIVSDGIVYREHVDGNGLVYHMNDLEDLERTLLLLQDEAMRQLLGRAGAEKMAQYFSWDSVARRRLADYQRSLSFRSNGRHRRRIFR